jgi:glutamyl-Q tRNA(Asp) synthetase
MTFRTKCPPEKTAETTPRSTYVGRFAPTPSGPLHQGSLVAALGSYLDARAHEGHWLLRMDDLDRQRCPTGATSHILDQLIAHGLEPDGPVISQRERLDVYQAALDQLKTLNRVYRCDCSRNTLRDGVVSGLIRQGLAGPLYPGTCRDRRLPPDQRAGWRFTVPSETVRIWDRRLGVLTQSLPETIGDPLVQRADGVFAYHLAEVVDNAAFSITDVVRGADLVPLAPVQWSLHAVLYPERPAPRYMHLPVLFDAEGRKLSKTNQAPAVDPRYARKNLMAAAQTLGLNTADPTNDLAGLLNDWTDQWRRLFVAGQQPVDPLEAPGQ